VIKALMIDVDGVLVSGRPSDGLHWAASLEPDLGLSFEILRDAFFKRHWPDIVTGRADLRERLARVLAQIAPKLTAEQVLAYWFRQDARLNHEVLEDLATLRRGGLRVHLATNQEHERARYLMNTLGLAAHVDGCHYSAAIGHCKPMPEFFDAVALTVGLPPAELLLIDDSEENVRGAIGAGWDAAHWTGRQRLSDLGIGQRECKHAGRVP
jgi:putative hydrolase of the HAD superfamily